MKKSFSRWVIFLTSSLLFLFFEFFQVQETEKEIKGLAEISYVNFERKKEKITLFFVGDIMLDRGVKYSIEKYGKGDYKFPFLKIVDELKKKADILFGNLESVISDKGKKVGSIYSFRADPEAIEGLKFAGFDILSVANNHIFDYGREAMEDSFKRLKEAKIDYLGGGFNEKEACSPIIKEIGKTKIAFLAFSNLGTPLWAASEKKSGICWLEKEKMERIINEIKKKADIVVVSFHYGEEYFSKPTQFQISISHSAIDSGANLVIGHHPHFVQPIEKYKSGWIAYSLGNFVFDQKFSKETMTGLMLKISIENSKIKEVIPIKIKINQFYQPEIEK
jgi:poly-gamma-glutamate synthesis protein (capsule biosynthesis protein)